MDMLTLEVFNMTLPPEGPTVVPQALEFDGSNDIQDLDLTQLVNNGTISYISGVFIDTLGGGNGGAVQLENRVTGQRVQLSDLSIAQFPLFVPNPPTFRATALDGFIGEVRLQFVNFPVFWGVYTPT